MFGSPCQSFSIAMRAANRTGLQDKSKSGLFLECYRILQEVSPKWFFVENVASMRAEDKHILSQYLGVEPIRINSKLVSAQLRDRLYWTNIPNVTMLEGYTKNLTRNQAANVLGDGWTIDVISHILKGLKEVMTDENK